MRLAAILREHPSASTPATHALSALMYLHAARLPARVDPSGSLNTLFEQDRSRWDTGLIAEGMRLLDLSATGRDLTEYHVEAGLLQFTRLRGARMRLAGMKSFPSMTSL